MSDIFVDDIPGETIVRQDVVAKIVRRHFSDVGTNRWTIQDLPGDILMKMFGDDNSYSSVQGAIDFCAEHGLKYKLSVYAESALT